MGKPDIARGPRLPHLGEIRPQPLFVEPPCERRHIMARDALVHRIRSEFLEMCGLSLTVEQAARLFGISNEACRRILAELMNEGLLHCTINGRFGLCSETP